MATYPSLGPLILRLALAVIYLPHGWSKLAGGPAAFALVLASMGVPLPLFWAWLVTLLETAGAVLLIVGAGTRWVASAFVVNMTVAVVAVKMRGGQAWELEAALWAMALALVFLGAGRYSVDVRFKLPMA